VRVIRLICSPHSHEPREASRTSGSSENMQVRLGYSCRGGNQHTRRRCQVSHRHTIVDNLVRLSVSKSSHACTGV
jgi:hypothetical protein